MVNPYSTKLYNLHFHPLEVVPRYPPHTVLQTVERHGVYSAAYATVHYKEHLKSFKIRVGHSPGFGLPSVAILP